MGNSYRIKATPGKDQNITLQVDQDFEQLEILSLKIRQDDVYLRSCSDYGVIAGRVFANNGYGIPNAKLSIFIPVSQEDSKNPVINSIYPYKSLDDRNEDGYKYNLLPYTPSYADHAATGTFPNRIDNLINQTAIEIYDKYYKYTVQTNQSGDYLIYGVPLGTQTLVMNLDLSDIGQFSLDPQDLIRMGLATEEEFDGNRFNTSANFASLPQIIVLNKTVEVVPFWGEEDVCQIGISRMDFDITGEANITIKPTSVFMGSLFSTTNDVALKKSCKARQATGNLCKMISGPGEIIAITQSIYHDSNGLPILEKAKLPNGGKLIDGDGTWLFDLPMNYDYVTTTEFGEQIISTDPTIGIPTKGKYRFKIKWQQSKNISEDNKRGYYLVPNVKENGWSGSQTDDDPLTGVLGPTAYNEAVQSYAFDLDWSGYTSGPLDATNTELLSYINCEDRFYEFDYNKVYTVASFIDNLKRMKNRDRFLAIKRINDDTCDDNINKFPSNDGVFHTSIFWFIVNILLSIIGVIGFLLIFVYDLVSAIVRIIWCFVMIILFIIQSIICLAICAINLIPGINLSAKFCKGCFGNALDTKAPFGSFKLPMITYPDCEACDCNQDKIIQAVANPDTPVASQSFVSNTFFYPFNTIDGYSYINDETTYNTFIGSGLICAPYIQRNDLMQIMGGMSGTGVTQGCNGQVGAFSTNDLPFGERINLFNSKGNYYNSTGGRNQIKVNYEPATNNPATKYHFDNTLTFITESAGAQLTAGTIFSLVSPDSSLDNNMSTAPINIFGTNSLTGITTNPATINIPYADTAAPSIGNLSTTYNTPAFATTNTQDILYTYPSDIEYYQVITAMTVTQFRSLIPSPGSRLSNSFGDIVESNLTISGSSCSFTVKPIDAINNLTSYVLICQRGIDINSPAINTHFELGKIFGYNNHSDMIVTGDYKLNIPVQNNNTSTDEILFNHIGVTDNSTMNNGLYLYYPSYVFAPDATNYQPYNTNLHTYYSSLDYNLVNSSSFSIFGHTLDSTKAQLGSIYTKNVSSQAINKYFNVSAGLPNKYGPNESLQGTSFIWLSPTENYYFSPSYSTGNTLTMSNSSRIVMRSDRLPSSETTTINGNNSYLLQQNTGATPYILSSSGFTTNIPPYVGSGTTYSENSDPDTSNAFDLNVLDTFSCENMVSLKCYERVGNVLVINSACTEIDRVVGGCYKFCPSCDCKCKGLGISCAVKILLGISDDFKLWNEYIVRFKFFFALCQDVLSEVFNNNWVNGTLFAFPFKVSTYYNNQNLVSGRSFCTNAVMLHPTTNNFYYRSSPWNGTRFIGQDTPYPAGGQEGSNTVNIKYPTTVLNMGPKDAFLSDVILNGKYGGYYMNSVDSTSAQDTSEITNLFAILRILSPNFLQLLIPSVSNPNPNTIKNLFSRAGKKVDADFAQSVAINSQLGIIPFDSESYDTAPPAPGVVPPVIAAGYGSSDIMMGIYFSATTDAIQIRDFVSPGRIINWNILTNTFAYDSLSIKSQETPHYLWTIQSGGSTIFGTQKNNWATDSINIQKIKYQELDRLSSPYPKYNVSPNEYNARGYLYADNSTIYTTTAYNISPMTLPPNPSLNGAPWYFYFGLIKGSSAMNKFYTKYVGQTGLNE